ncbi:MAG TPA: carbon monoxide dehydrogenase subunit G [Ktedonobacterales bacterium]|nr:carbon monoxide dehydrogenase subunit G [Ktedonobacterales bacterium]
MHFEGDLSINAPIKNIYAFFTDPHQVASCAPGFQSMEVLGPDHFKPRVGVGIGAVKATFTLDVTLTDLREPEHAVVKGHGVAAGSAVDIAGAMDLKAESDTVTQMHWHADVNVSGTIASVGARLMEGTAKKLTAKFFDCVRQKVEAPASTGSA